jgi:hypothetical protein
VEQVPMSQKEMLAQLEATGGDDVKIAKLGEALLAQFRSYGMALLQAYRGGSVHAGALLSALDPLIIPVAEEGIPTAATQEKFTLLEMAIDAQRRNQFRMAKAIDSLLEDTNMAPGFDSDPKSEAPYIPRRICDDAYLLMRKLLGIDTTAASSETQFLQQSRKQRDLEIAKLRKRKVWADLVHEVR